MEVKEQSNEPFFYSDILFLPHFNNEGIANKYFGSLANMKIKIQGDHLYLSNSWHRFYKNENHSDYTFSDVLNTYDRLEQLFGDYFRDGDIKKIAYGVNIKCSNPSLIYRNFNNYKGKPFVQEIHRPNIYGAKCYLSDWSMKGYNKTLQCKLKDGVTIPTNKLRFEIEVRHMRYLHNRKYQIPVFKVSDLLNQSIMRQLSDDLINRFDSIIKEPLMPLEGRTMPELNILASMQSTPIMDHMRAKHTKTYKRYRSKYKRLTEGERNPIFNEIGMKIREKCHELVNN